MMSAARTALRAQGARVAKAKNPLGTKVASMGIAQQQAMASAMQGTQKIMKSGKSTNLTNVLGKTSRK